MVKITYRMRQMLDRYSCRDSYDTITVPHPPQLSPGTSLYYIKTDRFNYLVLGKDDIIKMEEV